MNFLELLNEIAWAGYSLQPNCLDCRSLCKNCIVLSFVFGV
mgnify:CR=1 FL=1